MQMQNGFKRLPTWFRRRTIANERFAVVRRLIRDNNLHTVCQSAACPNQTECWNAGTATLMILGNVCTRGCRFCNVPKGTPVGLDIDEPNRVAHAVAALRLKFVVITSVTRDDLPDGGASIFAATIQEIRAQVPQCRVEVLIPDFQGSQTSLLVVMNSGPDILNHNLETVRSLYPQVRPQADYRRSLELLAHAHAHGLVTKTGLMLGLGENHDEVVSTFKEIRMSGCSILTLGQYLQPGKNNVSVKKYYNPDEFFALRDQALAFGFRHVVAGPLVRSSYHAEKITEGD